MNILNYFKQLKKQRQAENELVDFIIDKMENDSGKWLITQYQAIYGRLVIWVSNSPYADMTINSRRLPRRGELRRALAICAARNIIGLTHNPQ